jgi:hypothetical protein
MRMSRTDLTAAFLIIEQELRSDVRLITRCKFVSMHYTIIGRG